VTLINFIDFSLKTDVQEHTNPKITGPVADFPTAVTGPTNPIVL